MDENSPGYAGYMQTMQEVEENLQAKLVKKFEDQIASDDSNSDEWQPKTKFYNELLSLYNILQTFILDDEPYLGANAREIVHNIDRPHLDEEDRSNEQMIELTSRLKSINRAFRTLLLEYNVRLMWEKCDRFTFNYLLLGTEDYKAITICKYAEHLDNPDFMILWEVKPNPEKHTHYRLKISDRATIDEKMPRELEF